MARPNLEDMLNAVTAPILTEPPRESVRLDQETEQQPRYLQFTRKEARLTESQLVELATLARRLNRARRGAGERITENTLIRLAVDLLLHHAELLDGVTEDQLRNSLTL